MPHYLWLSHPFGVLLPRTRYNDPGDLPLDRAFTIDVATAIFPRTILRTPGPMRTGTHLVDETCCEARIVCREKTASEKE